MIRVISKDDYYFEVVQAVAKRATCDRGRSGAILVLNGRIIATGYVGSPSGTPHCDDVGHEWIEYFDETGSMTRSCIRTTHAEINALAQCAKNGPPCQRSILYSTMFPCYSCAKALVNAGIIEVHALYDYQGSKLSKTLFDVVGMSWTIEKNEYLYVAND
jgi:dCMP deaminase